MKVAKETNSSSHPIQPRVFFEPGTIRWMVPVNKPKGPLDDLIVQKGASCERIEWRSILEDRGDGCRNSPNSEIFPVLIVEHVPMAQVQEERITCFWGPLLCMAIRALSLIFRILCSEIVFATTVMKYVDLRKHRPTERLEAVLWIVDLLGDIPCI